jgi:hypothetical protein
MQRILKIVFIALATGLLIRAAQIHWQVWKAAEARKTLLAHFVDHSKNLTPREVTEAKFWSEYGDHDTNSFNWFLISGICAASAAEWLDRRNRNASQPDKT